MRFKELEIKMPSHVKKKVGNGHMTIVEAKIKVTSSSKS
jgi:hypothetical protein